MIVIIGYAFTVYLGYYVLNELAKDKQATLKLVSSFPLKVVIQKRIAPFTFMPGTLLRQAIR